MEHNLHRFGPFFIVRTLGRGGMGEVFIARTPWDENPVAAVKRLRPDVARVPTFAERFQHESELAVRLDHDNVVGTLDVGSVEGQLYVASKLILGKDTGIIADRLRERHLGGPAAVAVRLMLDTLAGLNYVHHVQEPNGRPLHLVHRDITPGNVLVGYDGAARLADFGLAKSHLSEKNKLTNHGEILGTPHYLAPEVIKGSSASPGSDLYGLGAVTYRFLTGVAPHQGSTTEVLLKVLQENPRPLSELRPDLPTWLVSFVHKLINKDPEARPNRAATVHEELTKLARAGELLVPRSAVGSWLSELFESEKVDDLEEYERVQRIEPTSQPAPEGTVVLATTRSRSASRLEAPSLPGLQFAENDGTELDLSGAKVRSLARQIEMSEADLEEPTRAVTVHRDFEGQAFGSFDEINSRAPGEPEGDEATRFGSFVDPESGSLPGFVEAAVPDSMIPGGKTHPEPPKKRRSNPDSVIVSGASIEAATRPHQPVQRPQPPPPSINARPTKPVIQSEPRVRAAAKSAGPPESRLPPERVQRNLATLVAVLGLAVVVGVVLGTWVATRRNPEVVTVPPPPTVQSPTAQRFLQVKKRMESLESSGAEVPPQVKELLSTTAGALIEGRVQVADSKLDEIERLLARL